jgi:lipid II:glycine glycyltransferase (peptidoglycan interpeptide bridge formation enzyme)
MEAVILKKQEIDANVWDSFVQASPQGMIYSSHYYISALEPEWQAVIVRSNDMIHAVMPFTLKSKAGISYSTQPIFTQYWGIMFRPAEANTAKSFEQKRQWVKLMLKTLPDIKLFDYNFSPDFDYPLPFFWNGYSVSPRYSNHIDLSKTKDELWSNISEKARGHIRKTEKDGIAVTYGNEPDEVIKIFRKAKEEKIKNMTDSHYKAIADIAHHYAQKGMCYTIIARDAEGQAIAGTIYFKFRGTTIHFLGTTDPEYKGRGAMSLIIWTAIQKAKDDCHTFDFEGSMIEPIEQFFLSFGSTPTPYLNIKKEALPLWVKAIRKLRG